MTPEQKIAEILVGCEMYDQCLQQKSDDKWYGINQFSEELIDPYYKAKDLTAEELAKECIANRQADALEDWLTSHQNIITVDGVLRDAWWVSGEWRIGGVKKNKKSNHQWRLDRIKWCISELIKEV